MRLFRSPAVRRAAVFSCQSVRIPWTGVCLAARAGGGSAPERAGQGIQETRIGRRNNNE